MARDYYQVLFNALRSRSLSELAKAAYEILDMPIVVTDSAFIVRAKYPDKPLNDEQWDANVINRQIEHRFVKSFTDDDHFTHHEEAGRTILTDWGHYKSAPRLTTMLRSGGDMLGYFAALTTGKQVEAWHYEASDVICEAFVMLMDASSVIEFAHYGAMSPALFAALNGDFRQPISADLLSADFVDQNRPPHMLFCAHTSNPHNEPLEVYLGHELSQYFECAVQTVYEGDLYILASEVAEDARGSVRGQLFKEALARQNLLCGSSRHFDSMSEIRLRAWEARSALRVGLLQGLEGPLFHYEDFAVDIIASCVDAHVPANALEDTAIAALRSHDESFGTSYLDTLKAYVQAGFDKKKTCKTLHIHRNTLQYRLERIQQMQGIDMNDIRYALYFELEDFRCRVGDVAERSPYGIRPASKRTEK